MSGIDIVRGEKWTEMRNSVGLDICALVLGCQQMILGIWGCATCVGP